MNWKTDSDLNELENEPYTSFQSNKSGKLFDRLELPIILIGAGLLALVILFVLFIPKKNEITIDDYKHLVSRLDQLEDKIAVLSGTEIDIEEFDPAENPVQYQQVINWIKSNAEVISETIKKVDEIEQKISNAPAAQTAPRSAAGDVPAKAINALPEKKSASISKPKEPAKPVEKPKPAEKPKPVPDVRSIEKSKPVQVIPQKETRPVTAEKLEEKITSIAASAPETKDPPKPVADVKPVPTEPGTVKIIFHRVEKGETLYRISRNYGISVEELQELNDMKKDDLIIDIGEELIVKKEKQ